MNHTPEEEFAVIISALMAGRIDGPQAVASSAALARRFVGEEREKIAQELGAMRHAWGGNAPWFTNGNHVADLVVATVRDGVERCNCGCALDAHVGEIGCPCGLPDGPPCLSYQRDLTVS